MIYGAIWRALPGPRPVKVLLALALVAAVVAFCFLWLFPRIAPLMPFNENTVASGAPAAHPAHHQAHAAYGRHAAQSANAPHARTSA